MTFVTQVNTTNEDAITALELLSIGVSLDALLDYVRIGLVLQAVFATIAFMTVLNYWLRSKQDPWYIKALVTLMSGFTLTQMVLSNVEFARLIREYNRLFYENIFVDDLMDANLLLFWTFMSAFCTQCFFGYRLWIGLSVAFVALAHFATSVATSTHGLSFPRPPPYDALTPAVLQAFGFANYQNGKYMKTISEALALVTLFADCYITGLIIYALLSSKTEWSKTNTLVTRLIVVVTESMLPPVLVHIVITGILWAGVGIGGALKTLHMVETPLYLWAVSFSLASQDPMTTKLSSMSGGSGGKTGGASGQRSYASGGGVLSKVMGGTGTADGREDGEYLVMDNVSANTLARSDYSKHETDTNGVTVTVDKYSDRGRL